jgi:hypothetical protein
MRSIVVVQNLIKNSKGYFNGDIPLMSLFENVHTGGVYQSSMTSPYDTFCRELYNRLMSKEIHERDILCCIAEAMIRSTKAVKVMEVLSSEAMSETLENQYSNTSLKISKVALARFMDDKGVKIPDLTKTLKSGETIVSKFHKNLAISSSMIIYLVSKVGINLNNNEYHNRMVDITGKLVDVLRFYK